jgi:DNA-binding CsgD family transcriptional regulator/DNA polymerase III delta prime subunit
MDLVEREPALITLRERLRGAAARGHIALLAGEAGIGKTSVLRALARSHEGPVWWGACDALQTPHPLAPLMDIAREAQPGFVSLLGAPRPALFEAVLGELHQAPTPVLVLIEDVHWADDATLDLLKFLGRRIERTRALLAISFRDDEVPASHPLRRVIGELPAAALTRIDLPRLSPQAVDTLARRAGRPARGVHAATQGNPFFVTEMLRDGTGDAVPRTVQDLVLARLARLPESARAVVRLASLAPARIEQGLVDDLLAPALTDIEASIDGGLLLADDVSLRFRHELARVAVESALSPPVAQALHARLLGALSAPGRQASSARLVHHAVGARDSAAVSRFAPLAASQARERGAHREAAAHWRTALHQGVPADDSERQRWLEAYALECQLTDQLAEAIEARQALEQSYQRSADVRAQARNLSRGALVHVLALRNAQADADSRRAIALLAPLPPCVEQAHAFWVQAQLRMLNRDATESADWSRRAIGLAEQFGDRETQAAARSTLGAALLFIDYGQACVELQEALRMALADGLHWVAANTYVNLGSGAAELFRLPEAERWLRRAVDYAEQHEIDFYLHYATAWLALVELCTGRWEDAATHADDAARRSGAATTSRVMALVALGRLRMRRGDPGVEEALAAALVLAEASGTLQRIAPVRAARAEWAWMQGDPARADSEASAALPLAVAHDHAWFIGELALWRWRAGHQAAAPEGCAPPYALEIAGRWREAAQAWERLGCVYERAGALAGGDVQAQTEALALFEALGARPACEAVRRRLREAGVRGVLRGARPSTRGHPCGLTDSEMKVLGLMAQNLRNADIAARLHRSVRTVDHHVAAVLSKLQVDSRGDAVRRAEREGWIAQCGQADGAI